MTWSIPFQGDLGLGITVVLILDNYDLEKSRGPLRPFIAKISFSQDLSSTLFSPTPCVAM